MKRTITGEVADGGHIPGTTSLDDYHDSLVGNRDGIGVVRWLASWLNAQLAGEASDLMSKSSLRKGWWSRPC